VSIVQQKTQGGVAIVPSASVDQIATKAGLSSADSQKLAEIYRDSQLAALRVAFVGLIAISLLSLIFARGLPVEVAGRARSKPVAT
jgi:hypothetical protein